MALSDFETIPDTEATATTPMEQTPYERDFLPTQRRFFNELAANPKISPQLATGILEESRLGAQRGMMQRAAVEQAGMDIKSRQMQFEATKFALETSREDSARKRDMLKSLQPFQQEIEGVLQNPNLATSDKSKELGLIGVRNAGLLEVNPAASKAWNAAQTALVDDKSKKITVFDYVNNGGDAKYLSEISPDPNALDVNAEVSPQWYLDRLSRSKNAQSKIESDSRLQSQVSKDRLELTNKLIDGLKTVKLGKDISGAPLDSFEDIGSESTVNTTINLFGSEQDKKKAASTTSAREKFNIATQVSERHLRSFLSGGSGAASGAAPPPSSLFSSKKTPVLPYSP